MWSCEKRSSPSKQNLDPLPSELEDAIKRLWIGNGSEADGAVAAAGLHALHSQNKWIACDCRAHEGVFPLMAPAYLSAFRTYYLRRLYGKTRPLHHPHCRFHGEPWLGAEKIVEIGSPTCPDGYFEIEDPLPRDLQPGEGAAFGEGRRSSSLYTDRLRLQFWRLMDRARLNEIPPPVATIKPSYVHEYAKLKDASERIHVGYGHPLSLVFETVPQAIKRRSIFARIRKLMKEDPGAAGQGFLSFMAKDVTQERIVTRQGTIAPLAGVDVIKGGAPYLVLVLIGADERGALRPIKACAQPILSGRRFFPIFDPGERAWIEALISEQFRMRRAHPRLATGLRRLLFDDEGQKPVLTHVVDLDTGQTATTPISPETEIPGIYRLEGER